MDALTALHNRVSSPRLSGNPPSREVLDNIFRAALRAPDHAQLRPWRFLVIQGEARERLGDLFVSAQQTDDPALSQQAMEKARSKPMRAPTLIVVIASVSEHPKVPEVEQLISAGAAAHSMLLAAFAQDVGAMWRTGSMAYHPAVEKGLGLKANERIVGYLYVGEVEGRTRTLEPLPLSDYVSEWQG